MTNPILPGATLGVLGSGQLGRMFAIAARRLGYRVHVYSPDVDTPAGQVADREFTAAYDDLDQLAEFARSVDVVTFEFENVPAEVTDCIQNYCPVYPSGYVLSVAQNRIREKSTLRDAGLAVPEFREVTTAEELREAVSELGTPSVVKTASSGYDGKGQAVVHDVEEVEEIWAELATDQVSASSELVLPQVLEPAQVSAAPVIPRRIQPCHPRLGELRVPAKLHSTVVQRVPRVHRPEEFSGK